MSFNSLGLSQPLLRAVSKKGYTTATPIQVKAIPTILQRRDVLASAQTGTGKTAGFTLPMLQLLSENTVDQRHRPIRALILTPTRELAAQVQDDIRNYGVYLPLKSTVIFGGVNQNPQVNTLRQGVDILVATPGRLLDLHQQGLLSLHRVEFLVLDEADRMLDMGFQRDLNKILALLPAKRQNLLFSATFSPEIKQLANAFLHQPVSIEATPENSTVEVIRQKVIYAAPAAKTAMLAAMIKEGNWQQVLVFTRTKHGANKLSEKLAKQGITAAAIHGNKSQGARTKALADFKAGAVRVLVATDIAARGLDIPLLPHVVNFELPNVPEDYVHRIGRTGRAGASGEAISLMSDAERPLWKAIEKLTGNKIQAQQLAGFDMPEMVAEPVQTPAQPATAPARKKWQHRRSFRSRSSSGKG